MTLRLSGGRRLLSPPGSTARPTASRVRLAVMNLLAADLAGARWLDLCCGSGVMACEALQRGASAVVAVDRDRRMATTAQANLEAVAGGLPGPVDVKVICRALPEWLEVAESPPGGFKLIYLDPPYAAGLHAPITHAIAAGDWLAPDGRLVWECASRSVPEVPAGWRTDDTRRYGSTTVLLLSPPEHCRGGTGSRPQRTDPPA